MMMILFEETYGLETQLKRWSLHEGAISDISGWWQWELPLWFMAIDREEQYADRVH